MKIRLSRPSPRRAWPRPRPPSRPFSRPFSRPASASENEFHLINFAVRKEIRGGNRPFPAPAVAQRAGRLLLRHRQGLLRRHVLPAPSGAQQHVPDDGEQDLPHPGGGHPRRQKQVRGGGGGGESRLARQQLGNFFGSPALSSLAADTERKLEAPSRVSADIKWEGKGLAWPCLALSGAREREMETLS